MATTTKELSLQLEDVTARLRAIEAGQHVMTSSPGLPLEKWSDHGFVHRHEIKPLVRAINNGGGGSEQLEERVEVLESGQAVLTSSMRAVEANQLVLTSVVNTKQDELTAGSGIEIEGNVISATGGGGGSSIYDAFLSKVAAGTTTTTSEKIGEDSNFNYYFMGYHAPSRAASPQLIERINVALAPIPGVNFNNPLLINYFGYATRYDNRTCIGGPDAPIGYINVASSIITVQSVTTDANGIYLNFSINSKFNTESGSYNITDLDFFLLVADPKTT